jgi:hypothetical protein
MLPACRRFRSLANGRSVDVCRLAPSAFRHSAIAETGAGSHDSVTIPREAGSFFYFTAILPEER